MFVFTLWSLTTACLIARMTHLLVAVAAGWPPSNDGRQRGARSWWGLRLCPKRPPCRPAKPWSRSWRRRVAGMNKQILYDHQKKKSGRSKWVNVNTYPILFQPWKSGGRQGKQSSAFHQLRSTQRKLHQADAAWLVSCQNPIIRGEPSGHGLAFNVSHWSFS